jgi:hypothetical protein
MLHSGSVRLAEVSARAWLGATRGFHDLGTDAGKVQQAVGAAPSGAYSPGSTASTALTRCQCTAACGSSHCRP